MRDASDQHLAARIAATGDQRAFGELVSRHQGMVRAFLKRLTRDPARADDLAQDTFLRAYHKMDRYSGTGKLSGWLCAIAYREFLMAARKDASIQRTLDAAAQDGALEPPAAAAPGAALDLDRALAVLTGQEREAVLLCFAGGMSHGEAAEAMGVPLGTVKSWVHRAKAKLKERLGDHAPA